MGRRGGEGEEEVRKRKKKKVTTRMKRRQKENDLRTRTAEMFHLDNKFANPTLETPQTSCFDGSQELGQRNYAQSH